MSDKLDPELTEDMISNYYAANIWIMACRKCDKPFPVIGPLVMWRCFHCEECE